MLIKKLMLSFITLILFGIFIYSSIHYLRLSLKEEYQLRNFNFLRNNGNFMLQKNIFEISCHKNVSLVIVVLCQTKDRSLRNIIRHTWAQYISKKYSPNLKSNISRITFTHHNCSNLKLFFVLGSETSRKKKVEQEFKYLDEERHFKDIMYFPGLKDSYMNLTLKTLVGLNNALETCSKSTFFLKTDTDIFLNVPRLIDYCNNHFNEAQKFPLIFGNKQEHATVIRDKSSKWFVPFKKYAADYFPNYVTGCGYILSRLAVTQILTTASKINELFSWEDVAVTGIYSNNVTIVDTKLIRYESFMSTIDSCYMSKIILAHRISTDRMISLWNEIARRNTSCGSN